MKRKYPVVDAAGTGQNIKHIMQSRGLTVKDVQKFLGLGTPQGIYHWFDGRSLPSLDNLYALSELFELPVDSLLKGNRQYRPIYTDYACMRLGVYFERLSGLKAG